MDNLTSQVEWMKKNNKTSVAIFMGDAIGVIQIQDENSETTEACFSSDQKVMNVRPEKH